MPGKLINRVLNSADLIGEVPPGMSLVEIAGDNRVLIENHYGITSFSKETIHVKTTFGIVAVAGKGLELACMSKHQLVISGCVSGITLYRGHVK